MSHKHFIHVFFCLAGMLFSSMLYGQLPGRVTSGLQALYEFTEGSGTTVNDISGVGTPMNLTIENGGAVSWIGSGGLTINTETRITSSGPATKIINAVAATSAISFEAWIKPTDVYPSGNLPRRVMGISNTSSYRNISLMLNSNARYAGRIRTTSGGDNNGMPTINTSTGMASTTGQHLVYTRDAAGNEILYLDGTPVYSGTRGGNFSNWDASMRFILGNEDNASRPFYGNFHLAAVYDKALSQAEVTQNYDAGCPGTDHTIPPPWSFSCTDDVVVELIGKGVDNQSSGSLFISDPSTVDSIIVEAVHKGGTPPANVIFSTSTQSITAPAQNISKAPNGNSCSSCRLYRAKLDAAAQVDITTNSGDMESFVAFIFRSGTGNGTSHIGVPVEMYFYRGDNTFPVEIPTDAAVRDITITVPVSEMTADTRVAIFTASAGTVTDTVIINNYSLGNSLNMVEIVLEDVPGSIDEIEFKIESPNSGGDSYVIGGNVDVKIECGDPCVITDAGEIGPDQSGCGPFYPDPINSIEDAQGSGPITYQWLYSLDPNLPFEMWVPKPNSNSATMPSHFVDKSCWLVRCVMGSDPSCTEKSYSNVVVWEVKEFPIAEFVVPGGTCQGVLADVSATTADGTSVSYSWTFENGTPPSDVGQHVQASWTNPGTYNITLSVDADGCVSDLTQPIMIDNCVVCDNITGGGSIKGGDATCVIPFDPAPLTNNNLPSTGTGALEFVWLTTTDPSLPQNQWTMIPNSNSMDYDPGPLTETTYFLRCVRRAGCDSYKESNVIAIEVVEGAHNLCKPLNFDMGSGDFSVELGIIEGTTTGKYYFSENERKFVIYTDGTAKLEGKLIHTENSNQRWDAEIWFKSYKDWGDWSALGRKAWPGNFNTNKKTWEYYEIDAAKSTLTGKQWFKNKVINLAHTPTNISKGFQVGEGANTESGDYGAYGEFTYSGSYGGSGSIKISFEGCQDVCTPDPKVAVNAYLEVLYNPATQEMNPILGTNGLIPGAQPFTGFPWFHTGTEAVGAGVDMTDFVDWALVEVLDASTNAVMMRKAGLLDKTGLIREASNGTSLMEFVGLDPDGTYYLTLKTRNHLNVSTAPAIQRIGRVMTYDFTQTGAAYVAPGLLNPPTKTASDGAELLIAGDINGDGLLNATDYSLVISDFFLIAYLISDANLDSFINGTDLSIVVSNFFQFEHVR